MSAGTGSLCWTFLIVSVIMFVSAEQKNIITAEPGQNVTLPCQVPNYTIIAVNWSRADLKPEYVLLYQDGQFVPDNQHPSFQNRVDLQDRQMNDGDVSLILEDVWFHDGGTYECSVFTAETQSWELSSIIYLRVVPPEQEFIIAPDPGQEFTLPCQVPNYTIIAVNWSRADLEPEYVLVYQDGRFVPDNQHPSFKNRVDLQDRQMNDGDVSVILEDVTFSDGGTYECSVFTAETQSWELSSIIYLRVVPPDWKDISSITAEPGQDVTLPCKAPNNNIIIVKWSRVNVGPVYQTYQRSFFHSRVERPVKDGDMSVILKNVTTADSGMFKCEVTMTETYSVRYIFLWVAPPEQKTITADPGQNVTLTCGAPNMNNGAVMWSRSDLEPECVFFYWFEPFFPDDQHPSFKNRVDLQDRQMNDGDVSLILKDVTTDDEGTYKCIIIMNPTNLLDPINISSIIYLRVVAPPGPALRFVALIVVPLLLLAGVLGFLIYRKQMRGSLERLTEIDEPPQQSYEMDADSCRSQTSGV